MKFNLETRCLSWGTCVVQLVKSPTVGSGHGLVSGLWDLVPREALCSAGSHLSTLEAQSLKTVNDYHSGDI